ncbi:MAG: M28 family peptidase [Bacteroidetes bacterium]|nr:M28 family peptidase [Bacteroidota bacterium]
MNRTRALSSIIVTLLFSMLLHACGSGKEQKDTMQSNFTPPASPPTFSGPRSFSLLEQQVAFGPRVPNTEAHARCLEFFIRFFDSLHVTPELQRFEITGYKGEKLALTNVIARLQPSARQRILLAAHWDSRPFADMEKDPDRSLRPIPGANDGASGVAVLLHLAEILQASPPGIGVDIVLFDGEDYGRDGDESMFCLGAKYFSASLKPNHGTLFGILLDLVGDRDAVFPKEKLSGQYAGDIQNMIWREAARLGLSRFSMETHSSILDDHVSLNTVAGIKTVDIIDAALVGHDKSSPRRQYWHTLGDTPEQCSPEPLGDVGRLLLSIIYGLHSS